MDTKNFEKIGEKLITFTHEFGLPVFYVPKATGRTYACLTTKYGSTDNHFIAGDEIRVPDGIAHFLEHKMFEQPDGSDAFTAFAATGANANAYTTWTNTAYLFSCAEYFEENLDILTDFVYSPHFTKENVAKEQGIIAQEIKMYEDSPAWRVFFNLLDAMYKNNPIKIDIAGTVESINKITPEILYDCYNTFYNPANMYLCLSGDIDFEKTIEILDKNLPKKAPQNIERIYPVEPEGIHKSYVAEKKPVSVPMFLLGFKCDSSSAREDIILDMATQILFGSSSKFYQELYNSGLINETFEAEFSNEKIASFVSMGGVAKSPKAVHEEILKYINKKEFDFSSFDITKKMLIGEHFRTFNDPIQIGRALSNNLALGYDVFEYLNDLESITKDEVASCAEKIFAENNSVLSVIQGE
ncbi:EF-P 5-aminopentanol modification-associated protein YfmH [Treponema sp. R6D11]